MWSQREWFSLLCALGLTAVAACGGGDASADDDDSGGTIDAGETTIDAAGDGADAFVPPAGSFQVQWGPVSVPAGQEATRCVTRRVGNEALVRVGQIHNQLNAGSHHLIVYRVSDTTERPEPYDCTPFAGTLDPTAGSPIMITQKHDDLLTLPEGVAYSFAPQQMVRLEMHYVNASDQPVEVSATSTFIPIADAAFQHEADFLFLGNVDISLKPNETKTIGPAFLALPAMFAGAKFFALTGHTHQFGTNVQIASSPGANDSGTERYQYPDWSWDEPPTAYFDPGFTLPDPGGFRFSCTYTNTSANNVKFGESVDDEMCFFWAYYYPSVPDSPKVCAVYGQITLCCPSKDAVQQQLCNSIL